MKQLFQSFLWAFAVFTPALGQAVPSPHAVTAALPTLPASRSPVLDRIRAAHALNCGISKEEEDYSRASDHGNRAAFDIDMCKALAVATVGAAAPLNIKSYPDEPAALAALQAGAVDVVASASPSVTNTTKGITFTRPTMYDGQSFLLLNNMHVHSPIDLAGKKICFLTGSAAEAGLHSYAAQHGVSYIWYPFSEAGEMEAAFFTGNCDAVTSDVTQLANIGAIDPQRASGFLVLPILIRQDPLAVATSGSDPPLAAIVNWTVETLIEAEELGVTEANVRAMAADTRPEVQQMLGQRYGTGTALGISPHWGAEVISTVGNYGEIFSRDLGQNSSLRLDRGENKLYTEGGLMMATPVTDH